LYRLQIERDARDAAEALGHEARVGVVLRQAVHHALQRRNAAGRKDPYLSQSATHLLSNAPRTVDEVARTAEQAAHRA
jgi:hypothetical protein